MNKLVKRNMILLESRHLFHGGLRICDIFKFINKTYLFTELLGEHFKSWKTCCARPYALHGFVANYTSFNGFDIRIFTNIVTKYFFFTEIYKVNGDSNYI